MPGIPTVRRSKFGKPFEMPSIVWIKCVGESGYGVGTATGCACNVPALSRTEPLINNPPQSMARVITLVECISMYIVKQNLVQKDNRSARDIFAKRISVESTHVRPPHDWPN